MQFTSMGENKLTGQGNANIVGKNTSLRIATACIKQHSALTDVKKITGGKIETKNMVE